jgi:hypothetical protein
LCNVCAVDGDGVYGVAGGAAPVFDLWIRFVWVEIASAFGCVRCDGEVRNGTRYLLRRRDELRIRDIASVHRLVGRRIRCHGTILDYRVSRTALRVRRRCVRVFCALLLLFRRRDAVACFSLLEALPEYPSLMTCMYSGVLPLY